MSKRCLKDEPKVEDNDEVPAVPVKKNKFSIETILESTSVEICKTSPKVEETPKDNIIKPKKKFGTKIKEGPLNIDCKLEGSELWEKFYDLGTEMIITKSGRRMFPTVKISFNNVNIDSLYYIFLDVIPVDSKRYRYIYNKSAWLTAGKAEPVPRNRMYLHPDCPFSGEQLIKHVISFEKTKLTNNEIDKAGHLILNSMHKYQPRIHVVQRSKHLPLDPNKVRLSEENYATFTFPETQFMAVTAYQNQLITKLKIEKNPFAKGFRDPSGRSTDDMERTNELNPFMLSNFYQSSAALQNSLIQQCFSKTMQLNPSALLSQMFFLNQSSIPTTSTSSSHHEIAISPE